MTEKRTRGLPLSAIGPPKSVRTLVVCRCVREGDLNGASKFCEYAKQHTGGQTKLSVDEVLVESENVPILPISPHECNIVRI